MKQVMSKSITNKPFPTYFVSAPQNPSPYSKPKSFNETRYI